MLGRLTQLDEWPRHQVARTFDAVAIDSPHWSDGYCFTLGDTDGDLRLYTAICWHANTDVADGCACATVGGSQHNLRWSRRLRPAIDELTVGPLGVEIIEPLVELRTTCGPNPHGITYDLRWRGLHQPYLENYVERWGGGRLLAQRCNYDQCCDVEGWVDVEGSRFTVESAAWVGVREHSWGVGSTGGPRDAAAAPLPAEERPPPFALRQRAMFRPPTRVVWWQLHEDDSARLTSFEHRSVPRSDVGGNSQEAWSAVDVAVEIEPVPGHRRLRRTIVTFVGEEGHGDRFEATVTGPALYLQGCGHWDGFEDGRGRGVYRGDDHHEGEAWDVSHPTTVIDPKERMRPRPDAWGQTFATCRNLDDPRETGLGHLECELAGPAWS